MNRSSRGPAKWLAFLPVTVAVPLLLAAPASVEPLIRINQIGYLPDGNKVAVIADPQVGPDADLSFSPGSTYQVRRWDDDSVAFEGAPVIWKGGDTHAQSGDRGWWLDFSALTDPGSYYVWDVDNTVGSHRFEVADDVYDELLKVAVRTFFYQRCGFAKEAPYAGEAWADGAAFLHPGQDTEIRSVYDRENPATERDLRGGWFDAGDYNKYVTFAEGPVHQLLHAWEERPEAFGDDYGTPESGNGIPDILDEVHFEMQWVARMQGPDGGVLLKMGEIDYAGSSPPSSDTRPRYYVPACSSSTIAAASMYAHAALVFRRFAPWEDFAAELEQRAIDAWTWYHANPKSTDCDEQIVKSGDADRSLQHQGESAVAAATYLHRLTGDETFRQYVEGHYLDTGVFLSGYTSVYNAYIGEPLLHYMNAPEVPAAVAATIRQRKLAHESDVIINWTEADLYRGHMPDSQYHWGSHYVRANIANASLDYAAFGLDEADLAERRMRAENLLHTFLGLNPLGVVYLTNLESLGAEESVQQIYHTWFGHGTPWDTNPPPGYVPGGPNKDYSGSVADLKGLPPQKSYRDFNDGWPESSWEITEPAIYYQAAFIKMLSKFVSPQAIPPNRDDPDHDGIANVFEDWFGLDRERPDRMAERISVDRSHLVYTRRRYADPAQLTAEWSANLGDWIPFDPAHAEMLETTESRMTVALPFTDTSASRLFVRFRAPLAN